MQNTKKQPNLIKTIETKNPNELFLSKYYCWCNYYFDFNYVDLI